MPVDEARVEALGPAELIVQTVTNNTDHLFHGRPGVVEDYSPSPFGKQWTQAAWKEEDGLKTLKRRMGKRWVDVGTIADDGVSVMSGTRVVARYQPPGIFPEAAAYLYKQVAKVWEMDNEFAARWASWTAKNGTRDMKALLAAFMLVQSRHGAPIYNGDGEVEFHDDDYRSVAEAMFYLDKDFIPKQILRVKAILCVPEVAAINRELNFTNSLRNPFLGRFKKAATRWLEYRESNPNMLKGLLRQGMRKGVMRLAQTVRYKPTSKQFFKELRWKQKQAADGHRTMAIGEAVSDAEDWNGLTEEQICNRIVAGKLTYKVVMGRIPSHLGLTAKIMAAVMDAGGLSDKDMVILTPTLEDLGLLKIDAVRKLHTKALAAAEDARARNIAANVQNKELKQKLEDAADAANQKALEEVTKNLRIYFLIDKSGSMHQAVPTAIQYLKKIVPAFSKERVHLSVFDTVARQVDLKTGTGTAIGHALRNFRAGGGTNHAEGIRCVTKDNPCQPNEDAILFVVGDQEEMGADAKIARAMQSSGIPFSAVFFVDCREGTYTAWARDCMQKAAARCSIPFVRVNTEILKSSDPYVMSKTFRDLIASTPVVHVDATSAYRPQRKSLVKEILETELLQKPAWAC